MFIIKLTLSVAGEKIVRYYTGHFKMQAYSPYNALTYDYDRAKDAVHYLNDTLISRFDENVGFVAEMVPAP